MFDEHNNKHTEACSSLFFVVFLRVNCSICAGLLTVHIFINEIWTKLCDDTNCTVKMIIIWGYLVFISMDYHSSGLSYCEPPLGIAHELHRSNCFLSKKYTSFLPKELITLDHFQDGWLHTFFHFSLTC